MFTPMSQYSEVAPQRTNWADLYGEFLRSLEAWKEATVESDTSTAYGETVPVSQLAADLANDDEDDATACILSNSEQERLRSPSVHSRIPEAQKLFKAKARQDTLKGSEEAALSADRHPKAAARSARRGGGQAAARRNTRTGGRLVEKDGQKFLCHFIVGIEQERRFDVVRRVLGSRGANVKVINASTSARLRLRGKGSGFKEGPENAESADPLMLCVSCEDQESYHRAVQLVTHLLEDVCRQYRAFKKRAFPNLCAVLHEGRRQGSLASS